jgi:hypothetical protein
MTVDQLDADVVRQWATTATTALGSARTRIDAVNVFPVPDADTGTNVFLTVASGSGALVGLGRDATVADVAVAFARGSLVGARGNSGVIVSQFLEGFALSLESRSDDGTVGPLGLAEAFGAAQLAARAAVAEPVEGTVLTAATRAAEAAYGRARTGGSLVGVLGAAVDAAHASVLESRDVLPVLRDAGVVDAGAWALVVLLEALRTSVASRGRERPISGPEIASFDDPGPGVERAGDAATVARGSGEFEVMFLVEPPDGGGPDLGASLRARLQTVGDSVAVVGGHGVWQVHVHTDDPAQAILAGALAAQRQITVRSVALQLPEAPPAATGRGSGGGLGVVVGTRARALVADLARTGAVVHLLTDRAPSPGELVRAIVDTGCDDVVVLPGDHAALATALLVTSRPPFSGDGTRVHVLRAVDDVSVVVAMATLVEIVADDAGARVGAVELALHGLRTIVVDESPAGVGSSPESRVPPVDVGREVDVPRVDALAAAGAVMTALADGVPRIVTVLTGDRAEEGAVEALVHAVRTHHPESEVVVLGAGVERPSLAIGIQPLAVPATEGGAS